MGVAGCGKTSVGLALQDKLGWRFIDGDALHPLCNIQKMEAGIALNDEDRAPWLDLVGETLRHHDEGVAIGCSALKRKYRDQIRSAAGDNVCFIHLGGSRELIAARMLSRKDHFMPPSLLDSQFATLEPPIDENAIEIDIEMSLPDIVEDIARKLAQKGDIAE